VVGLDLVTRSKTCCSSTGENAEKDLFSVAHRVGGASSCVVWFV